MRRALVPTVLAGLGLLLSVAPLPTATASCAGPELDVEPGRSVEQGEELTIEGRRFVDGCNDYGCSSGPGCDTCTTADEETPMAGVVLTLVRGDRSWPLGQADADADGTVTWTVEVPDDLPPGRARLVTEPRGDRAVPVRVL